MVAAHGIKWRPEPAGFGDDGDRDMYAALCSDVAMMCPPRPVVDGDCLVWAPRLAAHLRAKGHPADDVTVVGWIDSDATVIGFLHRAVQSGRWICDVTAAQFAPTLPAAWIAPVADYCTRLTSATRVYTTTIATGDGLVADHDTDRS